MEVALLLDAIKGHAHPHLARVVRPYLRRNNPEIRKRALACLAEAGPAASAWVLPYVHEDEPLPVVRQGLLALGKAEVPGLGQTIASWLFHGNMNIKKTAAELLANISDPGLAKMLVDVLAWQDQPGLRQLVEHALHTMAPRSARLLLVDKLLHTKDPRQQEQLASSLAPGLSAETFAALLAAHPKLPDEFVRTVIAAHAKDAARFDTALRRRDLGHRFPKTTDVAANHPQRPNLARSDLQRMLGRVRRHLLESPFAESVLPDTRHSLLTMAASFPGLGSELSALEQRLLANLGMHADEPLRQAILVLLADTTDAFVQARIQPWMRLEGEIDPRCEALLPAAVRRSNLSITRRFVNHPMLGVRAAAVRGQLISEEFHWTHSFVQERREVIRRWVQTGREHLLPNVILGQDQTTFLEAVQCLHIQLGKTAAWEFAQTFVSENPHERERYLLDVTYLGDCVLPWLLEFVLRCGEGSLRKRAIEELARMSLDDASTFLQSFLDDKHSGVVIVAAQSAIAMGNEQDRRRILDRWLEGKLAGGFHVPLRDQDVDQVLRAVENASTEAAQMHLYAPIEALPSLSRIQLWLRLRQSQHPRIAAAARDALRALPPADVWMTLEGPDRQKWFGFLDVLGPSAWLPPFLVEEAKTSDTPEDWMNFALRAAGQGLLYPGTLGRTIARWTADSVSPTAFSVLARLTDWYDDKQAAELLAELNPVLQSEHRERLVRMFEDALHEAPPSLIVRLLAPWVRPTDTVAVRMLANAEASSPGILALVGPELRAAMEGAMAKALEEADPETARTWLTYFAQRAEHAVERERVLVLLEKHIGSSSRRVRLHAHRLLRTLAPKERYVRASRRLLEDTDPTTLRLALRILAFGGDLESVDKFVEYLFHTHTAVARSAREGLLVLGPRAI
ncbi:MAG TPA: hypothetical protein PKA58_22135, partial [Polyangium sp.]|nr:hypothetical protein [Polyangium sp.]